MSEYQYYEFVAIDKPLTDRQIEAVRKFSSRADITPTHFVNEYNYGNFRGDEHEFLAKYFDAMVYVTNWGTRRFMFRIPKEFVDLREVKRYCPGYPVEAKTAGQNVIFDFVGESEEGGEWEEGSEWMRPLKPLREEMISGDRRVLYLAWLLLVQAGEVDDSDVEPPVPPGLGKLTKAQKKFVEFMRLDEDLVAAAVEGSGKMPAAEEGLGEWITKLPQAEKDRMLVAVCEGTDPHVGQRLLRQFRERASGRKTQDGSAETERTVGQLRQEAHTQHSRSRRKGKGNSRELDEEHEE